MLYIIVFDPDFAFKPTNLKHISVALSCYWKECGLDSGKRVIEGEVAKQCVVWRGEYLLEQLHISFHIVTQSGCLIIIAYYTNLGMLCSFLRHDLCDFHSHTWLDICTSPQDLIVLQLKSPLKPTQIRQVLNNPVTYAEWAILGKKWLMLFLIYWSRIRQELS